MARSNNNRCKSIVWFLENLDTRERSFLNIGITSIGRGQCMDVRLRSPLVSKQHCEIYLIDGSLAINNFSSNGTWVNSRRVERGQQLRFGDVIHLGFNREDIPDNIWLELRRLAFVLKTDYQKNVSQCVDLSHDDDADGREDMEVVGQIVYLARALAVNTMVEIPAANNTDRRPPPVELCHTQSMVRAICANFSPSNNSVSDKFMRSLLDNVSIDDINGVSTIVSTRLLPMNSNYECWNDLVRIVDDHFGRLAKKTLNLSQTVRFPTPYEITQVKAIRTDELSDYISVQCRAVRTSVPQFQVGHFIVMYTKIGHRKKYLLCYVGKVTNTNLHFLTVARNELCVKTELFFANRWKLNHLYQAFKTFHCAEHSPIVQGMLQPTTMIDFLFDPRYISTHDAIFPEPLNTEQIHAVSIIVNTCFGAIEQQNSFVGAVEGPTACGKTRVLIGALTAMTTISGRSFKILIITKNDAAIENLAHALAATKQKLINANATNQNNFNYAVFQQLANTGAIRLRSIAHNPRLYSSTLTCKERLAAANITLCPRDKMVHLKKYLPKVDIIFMEDASEYDTADTVLSLIFSPQVIMMFGTRSAQQQRTPTMFDRILGHRYKTLTLTVQHQENN